MISIIAAISRNRVIGKNNKLPWHLPNDLKHFKKLTIDKVIVMGRKTYESIGKALPNRINVILTRNKNYKAPNCVVLNSIEDVFKKYRDFFVIGGSKVYEEFMPYADKMYITFIDEDFEGNTFFPDFDLSEWKLIKEVKGIKDKENNYDYYFRVYERKNPL